MKNGGSQSDESTIVHAVAPIRICDIGGWTDTWFAKHGAIFNIAVYPYVEVQVREHPGDVEGLVRIQLENYDVTYTRHSGEVKVRSESLVRLPFRRTRLFAA